ncbi:MAG: XdhC family protein [Candidatus Cloacimonetes bacterium]|nr:XdhC family protein [Candidatus Cloacimonadota bacterium]
MFDFLDYYQKLKQLLEQSESLWQAIVVQTDGSTPAKPGMHIAIPLTGNPLGNLGGGNLEYRVINMIREQQPSTPVLWKFNLDEQGLPIDENTISTSMICGGRVDVFVEPLFFAHKLYVIGAGHCGKALAQLASRVNFQVTLIDNRQDLLIKEEYHDSCTLIYNDYNDIEKAIKFDKNCFIVIMTYGHVHDKQVLEYCLRKPFFYLGMIGSEKKVAETFDKLRAQGFSQEDLQKVHAPVGLTIGSQTPWEIAVSITAELIRERNLLK